MNLDIESELASCGYRLTRDDFFDLVQEMHAVLHPCWSVEELTRHPGEVRVYCDTVRRQAEAAVPDEVVMYALRMAWSPA